MPYVNSQSNLGFAILWVHLNLYSYVSLHTMYNTPSQPVIVALWFEFWTTTLSLCLFKGI